MISGAKTRTLAFSAAIVSIIGVAVAQPAEPAPKVVELAGQQDVSLSPQQMLKESEEFLPAMEGGAETVREQVAVARERKDVVKTLCLSDKLSQMDLAMGTAKDRLEGLSSAVAQNDIDRARHQFTVLQVLRDRVRALVSEANQCIGEDTGFVGDSKVTVEIDPSIVEADPSEFPGDPLISAPPILSSPTL